MTDCACFIHTFPLWPRWREFGLSADRVEGYVRHGFAWAWPNVLLDSLVIVPIWFVVFLFRPPGKSSSE